MTPETIPATREHAESLAPRMRAAEVREVASASGETPLESLLSSLESSSDARTLVLEGQAAAIYGVVPIGGDVAVIWLLTSALVERHPKTFIRACIAEIARFLGQYSALVNFVDARYERSLRWAARMGANVGEARPFGCEGHMFHPVVWRRTS